MKIIRYIMPALIFLLLFHGCRIKSPESVKETHNSPLKNAIISYMSQPDYRNKDFIAQATGTTAELQIYDMDESMLYFSVNKTDFDKTVTLVRLTENPAAVEFGFEDNGKAILGAYTLLGLHRYFFRFPKNDFKVDSTREVSVDFRKVKYTATLKELADFANNFSIYGGNLDTNTGGNIYIANHGVFVSKKDEPSLKRLTTQIVNGETEKEKIAQLLLDFVNSNIKFSSYEATGGYEVLKRPNEVLLTGRSDCSGLTILYVSLLEQFEIDYILVYFKGHICAAVEGNFPALNRLSLKHENKNYTIAETTLKGFMIGTTPLEKSFSIEGVTFIQKPGMGSTMLRFINR